ncbi:hypothetical protein GXP75_18465 [Bacillus sp. HU-1818]|uniref:hypothetical protein n=1 Tax=Bacillus sp. HU-1818 TaxID=2704469 RepID=UPI001F5C69CB|nr:hypothetical protein [Bacillus sp. HU-1818]MCI3197616.1 hypothetical protein [Bacillus sp. HU-1818]
MKKISLLVIIVFTLAGCTEQVSKEKTENKDVSTENFSKNKDAKLSDLVSKYNQKIDELNWTGSEPQKIELADIDEPIIEGNGDYTRELIFEKDNSNTAHYTVRAINEEDGSFKGVRVFTASDNGKTSPKGIGSIVAFLLTCDSSSEELEGFLKSSEKEKDLSNAQCYINISTDTSLNAFTLMIKPK